jgi:hypothetical protein
MKRFYIASAEKLRERQEARAKRLVIFMGLIGPMILVGILLWIVHWDASNNSPTVQQDYFPSHYVNAAKAAEDPVATF